MRDDFVGGRRGFTLLEIVVALAIFAFSMTFVCAAFLSRQQSFLAQEEIARLQRNVRTGMECLERDIRNAGYGFPPGVSVRLPRALTGNSPVLMVSGLGVGDGGGAAPDNLYLAHLSSVPARLACDMEGPSADLAVPDAGVWKAGDIGIVYDAGYSDLFRVTRISEGGGLEHASRGESAEALSKAYGKGSFVARVAFAGYFIGTDQARGHTALFRTAPQSSVTPVSRAVADDIEDMQVRLRFRNGSERDGERIGVDPSPLAEAVGVRVHLAARGRSAAPGVHDVPLARWNRTDVASLSPFRGHRRRTMEGYFDLRNRRIGP